MFRFQKRLYSDISGFLDARLWVEVFASQGWIQTEIAVHTL